MTANTEVFLGLGTTPQNLLLKYANRHGLIAGATGTGKTISLQVLAHGLASAGVPVFLADVKGDLSGIAMPGQVKPAFEKRAKEIGLNSLHYAGCPTILWDIYGEQGHPIRTTISGMGPLLLSRLLELNDTQAGVLNIAFKAADDNGLLLLDFKDLRAVMTYVAENASELSAEYGNVSKASVGAIQRQLLALEEQGAEHFFGEPALALEDLLRCDQGGHGYVNVLAADKLIHQPRLYATFLLWLLSELFESLPEVGDLERPKLVFFFDEAHLLFSDAPKALIDKVEQVVRLIRSKGVGIYFVTQNPLDIPESTLGQLGNRVQHALRAFTPKDQKAVRAAAETFRANPDFDAAAAITELAVGEALVSFLDPAGIPAVVQRTRISPPVSRAGPLNADERQAVIAGSPVGTRYDEIEDRESAYEHLKQRTEQTMVEASIIAPSKAKRSTGGRQSIAETLAKSVMRTVGHSLGKEIVRGILGALTRGK